MKQTRTFLFLGSFCLLFLFQLKNASAQFITNGNASNQGGDCYHLTEDVSWRSGSIFSNDPIDLSKPFSLSGKYYFGSKDNNGADGIVFMFATDNTALGQNGGYLGFQGVTPSFAWEINDYYNGGFGDPQQDHMAILKNGSVLHNSPNHLVGPVLLANVENGQDHDFCINWNPSTNTFTASLNGTTISYTGDIVTEIFGGNPMVYFGFSSATGSLNNLHRVCLDNSP